MIQMINFVSKHEKSTYTYVSKLAKLNQSILSWSRWPNYLDAQKDYYNPNRLHALQFKFYYFYPDAMYRMRFRIGLGESLENLIKQTSSLNVRRKVDVIV